MTDANKTGESEAMTLEGEKEFRVMRYYDRFFCHDGYRLQERDRYRFLFWSWWGAWTTVELDTLGINGYKWAEHFGCKIIDEPKLVRREK